MGDVRRWLVLHMTVTAVLRDFGLALGLPSIRRINRRASTYRATKPITELSDNLFAIAPIVKAVSSKSPKCHHHASLGLLSLDRWVGSPLEAGMKLQKK